MMMIKPHLKIYIKEEKITIKKFLPNPRCMEGFADFLATF